MWLVGCCVTDECAVFTVLCGFARGFDRQIERQTGNSQQYHDGNEKQIKKQKPKRYTAQQKENWIIDERSIFG